MNKPLYAYYRILSENSPEQPAHTVRLLKQNDHRQKGKVTSYCRVVRNFPKMYVIDNVIAENKAAVDPLKKPVMMTVVLYANKLLENYSDVTVHTMSQE